MAFDATTIAIVTGAVSGLAGSGLTGIFIRKKTKAETSNVLADAAQTLALGAGELAKSNVDRILDLERRLTNAENAANLAHAAVLQARTAEAQCAALMATMRSEMDDLRRQITALMQPQTTTKVTTEVVTKEPPT